MLCTNWVLNSHARAKARVAKGCAWELRIPQGTQPFARGWCEFSTQGFLGTNSCQASKFRVPRKHIPKQPNSFPRVPWHAELASLARNSELRNCKETPLGCVELRIPALACVPRNSHATLCRSRVYSAYLRALQFPTASRAKGWYEFCVRS